MPGVIGTCRNYRACEGASEEEASRRASAGRVSAGGCRKRRRISSHWPRRSAIRRSNIACSEYLASGPCIRFCMRLGGERIRRSPTARGLVAQQIQQLIHLRLLSASVVRSGVEPGGAGHRRASAWCAVPSITHSVRADSGRAQRRPASCAAGPTAAAPTTLEEAREEVEMFHAYADAGLWTEADSAFVALDNPKHRFLAPVLERDLTGAFLSRRRLATPAAVVGLRSLSEFGDLF